MGEQKTVTFIIQRQDNPESEPYDETFEVPYLLNMNVISTDGNPPESGQCQRGKNNTCCLGNELFGRSLRRLFHGD